MQDQKTKQFKQKLKLNSIQRRERLHAIRCLKYGNILFATKLLEENGMKGEAIKIRSEAAEKASREGKLFEAYRLYLENGHTRKAYRLFKDPEFISFMSAYFRILDYYEELKKLKELGIYNRSIFSLYQEHLKKFEDVKKALGTLRSNGKNPLFNADKK